MNSDDMNDAELDAFLKGEDALSRRMQVLAQPAPSAELDAAILRRAEAMMAQENRPAAANDASDGTPSKASLSRLGLRWRVPAGIAATVMAGVLAHQAWQASADLDRAAEVTAPAPAPPSPPEQQKSDVAKPAPVPAGPAKVKQATPRLSKPAPIELPADASMLQMAPPPPRIYSNPAARAAAPAPAPLAQAPAMREESRTVQVSGSRRSRVDERGLAAAELFASSAPGAPDPKAWLAAIDELLGAGLQRDTLAEWDKFRAAYPEYPVPADTVEKINALRK